MKNVLDICYISTVNQPSGPKGHERSFQSIWFDSYSWLRYDEERDSAFCFIRLKAAKAKSFLVQALVLGDAFTKIGFSNWKKACEKSKGFEKTQPQMFIKKPWNIM